jgi:dynein heavy chain
MYTDVVNFIMDVECGNFEGSKEEYVMNVLKEVREKESSIEMEISPILDMYSMLEVYLQEGVIHKDEVEEKAKIMPSWKKQTTCILFHHLLDGAI